MTIEQQWAELMQRPNIDEAVARYEKMEGEITSALSTEFGLPPWEGGTRSSGNPGCGAFDKVDAWDAMSEILPGSLTPAVIPTNQWPRAVETIKRVASAHGFTTPGLAVDKDDFHIVDLYDGYAAKLTVVTGTEKANTVIGVFTGCHLLPEAKQRGVPRPA
ncbi:LppA family lipoprotein [Amycolatopsis magusensis]|uniref:LppA family lipoprotein n=1 Tax=Amycolatopsis magusensis TaxID=882444 RepID=UPI003C2F9C6C